MRRFSARATLGLLVSGIILGAVACSGGSTEQANGVSTLAPIVAERVTTYEGLAADDVAVQPGRLLFPKAKHAEIATKTAGDFLVGRRGASVSSPNKTGFIRKVVSVVSEGENYLVTTSPARLTDVLKQGEFRVQLQSPSLGVDGPAVSGLNPGLSTQGGKPIKLLDYSGKVLFDGTGSAAIPGSTNTIGYHAWAKVVTGTLDFAPKFDVGAKIVPNLSDPISSLQEAHVIATGTLNGVAKFDVGAELTGTPTGEDLAKLIANKIAKSTDNTLAEYDFNLGDSSIGPIPLSVNAHFKATINCDVKWGGKVQVVGGGKATATLSAGFKYEKGEMSPVFEKSASFEQIGPEWTINGDVYIKCNVRPIVTVNLFDMAAGEVWADAYAGVRAQAICNAGTIGDLKGEAMVGVSATAHAKVDVFGLFKWEKTCSLFDINKTVEVTQTFPLGPKATCTADSATKFEVTTHDAPPASCFGKKETSTPGGTCSGSWTPPKDWNCKAEQFGDCKCDCNCGGADIDCKAHECSGCDHDACTEGTPLGSTCTKDAQNGACIKAICENDSYCCEYKWAASCVGHARDGEYGCTKQCK